MWASLKHLEKHFHRVVVQAVLVYNYSCWFLWLPLLFEPIYLTLCWSWRKWGLTENWVEFNPIHCAKHISVVIELANRLVFFHVYTVSIDSIAFFVFPDVGWSYLNFLGHFKI